MEPFPRTDTQLSPDSPFALSRADIRNPAYNEVHPAVTQQIFSALEDAFHRRDLPEDTLRGVVLHHTEHPVRNIPEVVVQTPPRIAMAETMSPIGIANVRIANCGSHRRLIRC